MSGRIDAHLKSLGIELPEAVAPAANYVPYVKVGDLVHISGQISIRDGKLITGKVGADVTSDAAVEAAKACAINLISQLKSACDGDLDRVVRVVKLTGFVNSTEDFSEQPKVINGCSDLLVEVFGDAGRHARSAVSAASLPFNVTVEIEGVFQIS